MSVSLRLSRGGSKKRPYYKVVVANSRSPRDGAYLEQVGTYNPLLAKDDTNRVRLTEDRVRYWIGVGAQPTDRVARMLDKAGIVERAPTNNPKAGEPGKKAKERAEDKAKKLTDAEDAKREAAEAAAAAAAEAAAAPAPEAPVAEEVAAVPEETPAPEEAPAPQEEPAPEVPAVPEEVPAPEVVPAMDPPVADEAATDKTEG